MMRELSADGPESWSDPLTRFRLGECAVAAPGHERRHRAHSDEGRETAGEETAGERREAPEDCEEVADEAAHGVPAASRRPGAALDHRGGGSDRSDRGTFVQPLPVRRRL